MKKVLKFITIGVIIWLSIDIGSLVVDAEETSDQEIVDGEILIEPVDSFQSANANDFIQPYGSTYTKNTKVSSQRFNMQWIGYHSYTKDWAKASGYSLGKGKSYNASGSMSYSGMNISLSYNKTQSGTTTFKADSKRWSKLGVWADVTVTKWKTTSYDSYTNRPIRSWNTTSNVYHNYYVQVKYK